jgi:hypothetical protein
LGDPGANGFSPDRNSWAVLTAARNRVFTADDIAPATNLHNVAFGLGTPTERAWHTLLQAEGSDHWYWDGTEVWDSNVTLGCNEAVMNANQVISTFGGTETTPPTVFIPQRQPYNPGDFEFGSLPEPSDFEVWTYAYDVSGLTSVTLKYRLDADGFNPLDSVQNETYVGGPEVGDWISVSMAASDQNPPPGILNPIVRAMRYSADIQGHQNALIDYYVQAVDGHGAVTRTDIQHVWVGDNGSGMSDRVMIEPNPAVAGQPVTIRYDAVGGPLATAGQVYLHYGINNWSQVFNDMPLSYDSITGLWFGEVVVPSNAATLDMVFNNNAGVWDNNNGLDWHFAVEGTSAPPFVMDGVLDSSAISLVENGGLQLFYGLADTGEFYLATNDAGEGFDVFIYLALNPGPLVPANWAKSGMIAAWDGYLADENDNGFHSWFDIMGVSATAANGGVLEGVVDLPAVFGKTPPTVFVASGRFLTPNGGSLAPQLQLPPTLDNDGNIQFYEWIEISLANSLIPGDMNFDGSVDLLDVFPFILGLSDPDQYESQFGFPPSAAGDLNGDGVFDLLDVAPFVDLLDG